MLKKAFFFSLLITRQHVCKLEDMNLLGRKVLYINSSVFFQIFLLGKAKKKKKYIALAENTSFLFPQHLYVIGIFLSAFYKELLVAQVTKLTRGSMRAGADLRVLAQCFDHRPHETSHSVAHTFAK